MLTVGKQLSIEEAIKYNNKINDVINFSNKTGYAVCCTNKRACENCGLLLESQPNDCLCVCDITCPYCNFITEARINNA